MARPGRKRSQERIDLEKVPCETCGAAPGQSCLTSGSNTQGAKMVHAPRHQALEAAEIAIARGAYQ